MPIGEKAHCLHMGQRQDFFDSQGWMQPLWKRWPHGSTLSWSPSQHSER